MFKQVNTKCKNKPNKGVQHDNWELRQQRKSLPIKRMQKYKGTKLQKRKKERRRECWEWQTIFFVFRIGGGADVLDMSRTGSHFSDDFMSTDFWSKVEEGEETLEDPPPRMSVEIWLWVQLVFWACATTFHLNEALCYNFYRKQPFSLTIMVSVRLRPCLFEQERIFVSIFAIERRQLPQQICCLQRKDSKESKNPSLSWIWTW